MRDVVGSPGTWSGLALRVSECACLGASLAFMINASDTQYFLGFFLWVLASCVQFMWGVSLAWLDIYSLKTQMEIQNPSSALILVLTDWVISIISLGTNSAGAAQFIYLKIDINACTSSLAPECQKYELSVILVFVAWLFRAASAAAMFRLFVLV